MTWAQTTRLPTKDEIDATTTELADLVGLTSVSEGLRNRTALNRRISELLGAPVAFEMPGGVPRFDLTDIDNLQAEASTMSRTTARLRLYQPTLMVLTR